MARVAWSCLFVFAFAVATLVAPGAGRVSNAAFVAMPSPPPPPPLPPPPVPAPRPTASPEARPSAPQRSRGPRHPSMPPPAPSAPVLVPSTESRALIGTAMVIPAVPMAISSGTATEANPLMRGVAGNPAAFLAVKAGATAGTIWVAERMRKKHPARAVVFMLATNAAMAVVVAHNYAIR